MSSGYVVAATAVSVFAITLAIIFAALYFARRAYFRRKERVRVWGERYRMALLDPKRPNEPWLNYATDPVGLTVRDEFAEIEIFRQTTGRAHHILQGEIGGKEAMIFDYQFVTGSGKSSTNHFYSVVCFYFPEPCPRFEFWPHTFWDKITALFGAKDVLVGDPDFDKHFRVVAEDPAWLQRLMLSGIADTTLAEKQVSWHCLGDRLVLLFRGNATEGRLDALVYGALQFAQQAERY